MENINSLISMLISETLIFIVFLIIFFTQKKKNQLKNAFLSFLVAIFIWILGSVLQISFQNTNINPFSFEKISGIGVHFSPIAFLALAMIFANTKINLTKKHFIFLVIPIISTILLLTNEYHHLLYVKYSTNITELVYGKWFPIHSVYSYGLYFIAIIIFLKYSFKNSGFFSKQSLLLTLGTCIPLIINLLGTAKIIQISMYATPIAFAFMALFYAIAIFKFKFISSAPIALQKIVDQISDSYIILDENYNIIDFNETFLHTFRTKSDYIRSKNLFNLSSQNTNIKIQDTFKQTLLKVKDSYETFQIENEIPEIAKTFSIEINNIYNKHTFLGTLILFKDITQHKQDIQTIENNQEMLIEQERLVSLGQLIGGIAHNLKTPIFSVAGGLEGLSDLITEFDLSIDNDSVTNHDMHEIASDMREWIEKLKSHISYMSDIITTVKGQAVTLSESESINFSITELFKRVDILMKHEIKNALADLEIRNNVGDSNLLSGNINSLVQIVNNIISNSIEAYDKTQSNKKIELTANQKNNTIIISIKDYGSGISEVAQEKLFKEMITTKGKNGTGLGMFMSYSNIKAHFNGDLNYETELNKGTTFYITLPIPS